MAAEVGWRSKVVKDSGPEGLSVFLLPQQVARGEPRGQIQDVGKHPRRP